MLRAYCDESGVTLGGRGLLVLSGYLAEADQWLMFGHSWQQMLDRFKVPYFHAVDLSNGNARIYRHLSRTKRESLLVEASEIIGSHVDAGFTVAIRPGDWRRLASKREQSKIGSAYGVCMEVLLAMMSEHVGGPRRVSIFWEKGHANSGDANRVIKNFKYDTEPVDWSDIEVVGGGPIIGDYQDPLRTNVMRIGAYSEVPKVGADVESNILPIQAADLLAYCIATSLRLDQDRMYRRAIDYLLPLKPHYSTIFGPADVRDMVSAIRKISEDRGQKRTQLWLMKKEVRADGARAYEVPWGLAVLDSRDPTETKDFEAAVNRTISKIRGG